MENVWSTSIVVEDADGIQVVYSTSWIAESYEHAIGIALSNHKNKLETGEEKIVGFDACEQDITDLVEMMQRKGWQPPKEKQS